MAPCTAATSCSCLSALHQRPLSPPTGHFCHTGSDRRREARGGTRRHVGLWVALCSGKKEKHCCSARCRTFGGLAVRPRPSALAFQPETRETFLFGQKMIPANSKPVVVITVKPELPPKSANQTWRPPIPEQRRQPTAEELCFSHMSFVWLLMNKDDSRRARPPRRAPAAPSPTRGVPYLIIAATE